MSELKYCNYCDNCKGHRSVETHCWETDEPLSDNIENLHDWLNYHMNDGWEVVLVDLTYAEVVDEEGQRYSVYAGGNGDFCSHMVDIVSIEGDV